MKIYPAIIATDDPYYGKIIEINSDGNPCIRLFKDDKNRGFCGSIQSGEEPKLSLPKIEELYLKKFMFDLDEKRSCLVEIYIIEDLFSVFREAKNEYIDSFVKDRAPWFFTYGKRLDE